MGKYGFTGRIAFNNISVAQLKRILQNYSDNDTVSIVINKKRKPNTAPQVEPNGAPTILPGVTAPTCHVRPIAYKLSPTKGIRANAIRQRRGKAKSRSGEK
jgi:hypothetical protein